MIQQSGQMRSEWQEGAAAQEAEQVRWSRRSLILVLVGTSVVVIVIVIVNLLIAVVVGVCAVGLEQDSVLDADSDRRQAFDVILEYVHVQNT